MTRMIAAALPLFCMPSAFRAVLRAQGRAMDGPENVNRA